MAGLPLNVALMDATSGGGGGRRPNDPPEGSVGALLLTWRRSRNLSQGQAAEAFGVQRTTWCRWETGKRRPEADMVDRVKAELST